VSGVLERSNPSVDVLWAIVLALVLVVCWVATLIGAPGNWAMLVAAGIYWWFMPVDERVSFHWGVLVAMAVLATLGEVVEFAAGAAGATQAGGSKRSAALALAGSLVGGIVGLFVGLPVPVIGQLAAALIFASLGAMGGAVLGEHWKGRTLEEGMKVGQAAFWGRLWGTLGKVACGAVMLAVAVVAMIV
jgi:uncharacterized protein YqgC (DUF456 family)